MFIYATQTFTATDGTSCTAGNTYTVTDGAGQIAISRGQAQMASTPAFFSPPGVPGSNNAGMTAGGSVALPLGSTGQPSSAIGAAVRPNASIMWLGDSLTQYGRNMHPFATARLPYYTLSPSGIGTAYIALCQVGANCATGNGTLTFTAATNTMTWKANGDTVGPAVNVSLGGFFRLPSGTPGNNDMLVSLAAKNKPVVDGTSTVNVTGTPAINLANCGGFTGMTDMLMGNPWGESNYNYGISATRAVDAAAQIAQWSGVVTDVTVIHLGTNDIQSMADVTPTLNAVTTIINSRRSVGSVVIVGMLFPNTADSTAARQAKIDYNAKLFELQDSLGFETFDGFPYVADPNGATPGAIRTDCFRSDGLHLSAKGAYLVAKYALMPVLNKYAPARPRLVPAGTPYDATLCPKGNLLVNANLTGTAGTKGASDTGQVATSWTTGPSAASMTAVCTAPQSGSPIARTDGLPGNYQRFVITNTAGAGGEYYSLYQSAFISSSNYAAGDVLQLTGDFRIAGTGIIGVHVFFGPSTQKSYAVVNDSAGPMADLNGETGAFTFVSQPITMPAGGTNLQVNFQIFAQSAATITFDVGQNLSIRKIG